MIAALPMYDWPEMQSTNDDLWRRFADGLAELGFNAPPTLTRNHDLLDIWLSQDLLIAQTCSYPLETHLRQKVRYVATPSYSVEGCEQKGTYRSVILKRGNHPHLPVPTEDVPHLPTWADDDVLAINDKQSMSGYHAILRDAENAERNLPDNTYLSGGHRASIIAVANGDADFTAVDCVSWSLACAHEAAAKQVYVAGWTKIRPGLPLVTSLNCSETLFSALQTVSILQMDAMVLALPTEKSQV